MVQDSISEPRSRQQYFLLNPWQIKCGQPNEGYIIETRSSEQGLSVLLAFQLIRFSYCL